ncbi:unnamed protein product [Clavelina lepadiformis]|uniref:Sushi domain-containing protein n=1 Tax=Clavelina lepadiformis TaxID=159417 RepID=A0ABP0EXN1_CLALP
MNMASTSGSSQLLVMNKSFRRYRKRLLCISAAVVSSSLVACSLTIGLFLYFHTDDSPHLRSNLFARIRITKVEDEQIEWSSILKNPENDQTKHTKEMVEYQLKVALMQVADEVDSVSVMKFQEDQFARLVGASNRGVEVSFKIELSQMINSSKEVEDFKDKLVMFFAKDNKMVVDLDSLEITSDPKLQGRSFDTFETFLSDSRYDLSHVELSGITRPEINDDKITCPTLQTIDYGFISPLTCLVADNSKLGDTCFFFCVVNHTLIGEDKITCMSTGHWSHSPPLCKVQCQPLGKAFGIEVQPRSCSDKVSLAGTHCFHHCASGFVLDGDASRVCTGAGAWSGTPPVCRRTCASLSIPDSGNIWPTSCSTDHLQPAGTVCSFSCREGYALAGSPTLLCDMDGRWNFPAPTCRQGCFPLLAPASGEIFPSICAENSVTAGRRAVVMEGIICVAWCSEGYRLEGSTQRLCTTGGIWTGEETYCSKLCPSLKLPRLMGASPAYCTDVKRNSELAEGQKCELFCPDGFEPSNEVDAVMCLSNGSWSQIPDACIRTCRSHAKVLNGVLSPDSCYGANPLLQDTRCTLDCDDGFELRGSMQVQCLATGKWTDHLGECLKRCPSLTPPSHGSLTPNNCSATQLFQGSECQYICDSDYGLEGDESRTCLTDGTWSGDPPECVAENQFLIRQTTADRDVCLDINTVTGFVEKKQIKKCSFNNRLQRWTILSQGLIRNVALRKCIEVEHTEVGSYLTLQDCSDDDERQKWDWTDNGDVTLHNTNLQLGYGYASIGKIMLVEESDALTWYAVTSSGQQSLYSTFSNSSCPRLRVPSFTNISPTACAENQTILNETTCSFSCAENRKLVGEGNRSCSNGRWNGTYPTCETACQPLSPPSGNGTVTAECQSGLQDEGKVCEFDCPLSNYHLEGEAVLICLSTGNWSTSPATCTLRCPQLDAVENGILFPSSCSADDSSIGASCNLSCEQPYKAKTLTSLTCLTNGSWSFGNFSCEQGCYDVNAPPGGGNVSCDSDELWEGDQCTYSCGDEEHRVLASVTPGSGDTTLLADPGPSGTISRTCKANGTFNGTLPSCVSVCEQLSIPSNGTLQPSNCSSSRKVEGSRCELRCSTGFGVQGSPVATCQSDGEWSMDGFQCQEETQFVIKIKDSSNPVCLEVNTSLAENHLDYLRVLKRDSISTCLNSTNALWTWSSAHQLKHVQSRYCLAVLDKNAKRLTPLLLRNCSTSDLSQQWSCSPTDPHLLHLTHHPLHVHLGDSNSNQAAAYRHPVGHIINEKELWLGVDATNNSHAVAPCSLHTDRCAPFVIPEHATVTPSSCSDGNVVSVNTTCIVTCSTGYILRHILTTGISATCNDQTEWDYNDTVNTFPLECTQPCPGMSVESSVNFSSNCENGLATFGDVCNFTCDEPNQMIGEPHSVCGLNGAWSSTSPTCIRVCPHLAPSTHTLANQTVYATPGNCLYDDDILASQVVSDDECSYSCNPMYTVGNTSMTRTCLSNGSFDHSLPTCYIPQASTTYSDSSCGTPPSHSQYVGRLLRVENCTTPADTQRLCAVYGCSSGYKIPSGDTIHCAANSYTWPSPPMCKRLCPDISTQCSGKVEGEYCIIECEAQQTISHGNNRLLCNVDGTWSDTLPYCVDKAHFKIQSSLQSSGDSLCISHNGKVNIDAKVMLASCSPSNQNDLLWSWESSSLIRHIRSGFCLSSSDRKHGSSLKLEECNVLDQLQQWRCSDVADHPHRINLRSDDEFMWVAGSVLTGNSSDGVRLLHSSFFTDSQKNSSELGVSWVAINESQPSVTNVTLCAVQSSIVQCPPLSSVVPLGGVMEPSMCAETWSQEGQNCTLECGSGYTLPSDSSTTSECLREGTWSTLELECLQVCPNLASPEHGAISACNESSLTEGSTCDFTCDEDYELIGDSQRVCQWDGRWSGVTVLCAKRCETLPVPSNALVSPQECASEDSDVISGTVCLYTCVEGYRISIALDASSEVTRTCFQNGTWSDRAPSCVRVCSAQEDPPNGKISPVLCTTQSSTAGFSCKVKCDDGYAVFGNDTRECGFDGVWTNSVTDDLGAVCRSKCHPLPATDNSVMECNVIGSSSSEFVSGSRCSVECESGFGLAAGSSRTRHCNDSAMWTGQAMTCEREEQFAVFLRRTSKSNLKPHICLVADDDDLDAVIKMDHSQCQTEQNLLHKWSWYNNWLIKNAGTGRCLSVENLEVGEKLRTTTCDDVTNNKWSCDAVSGRPWFLRLAASNFFLDYGHASSTNVWLMNTESIDLKHDEVHWYARHFNPDGYTPLTQSPPVTVCSMRLNHGICSPLRSPAYGSVHPYACSGNEMGIHVGTKCQFDCVVGYKLTGGSTQATCQQNGLWSGATPLCTALCPRLPAPAHGRIFPPSCVENVDSDDEDSSHHTGVIQDGTCSFECNRGWRLVDGPSILSCLRSRKWNARQPTCKRVCPVLSSAENAEVLNQDCLTTELTEGSICSYQCHDGYAIRSVSASCNTQSNSSVMTAAVDNEGYCSNKQSENDDGYETVVHLSCSSDGKWSASEPDCGPLCPPLSYPKNGFVRPLSCVERPQVAGTSCAFECNEKYFARGEWSNVTCHSGKWIPTQRLLDSDFDVYGLDDYELLIPTCDFYCPPLVMVAVNRSTLLPSKCASEKNKVGSKCEIVCESGFILRGTPSVTCRHDGTWDGSLGFCLKKCPSLGAPPNGAIHPIECTMTQMGDGATCTFSCMDKYALDGAVTTLCNGSGLWSSPAPTCKRRCPALPQLYNGQAAPITSCFTEHITMGEQCSFSCLDGFLLVGSDTVECTESGEWNNEPPTCNRICANPEVNRGHVMCVIDGAEQRLVDDHVLTWGTKCRVECAVNYSPTRGTVFTCRNDGQWRPSVPDCVETGVAMYILQTLGSTSVCLTEDETKHVVVQMSQSKCLEHGDFVNPSTWRWLDQYNIQNAHSGNCIAVRSASENERIRTVPCNTGHPLQHWDCSVHNPFQVVLHGTILAPTTFYSSIGEVILQTWSDSHSYYSTFDLVTLTHSSICSRRPGSVCPPLSNPEGGRVVPVGNCTSDNVRAGQHCSYECNEGISLHGDDFTTCMGNGLWMNPPPICTNLCEPLAGDIAPSSYLIDADCVFDYLKVGHLCAAKCVSGYDLHGNDTRECLPSGTWSPLQYQCHRTCPSIFGILNGEVSPLPCRSNLCQFKCKPGYVLVGETRELRCVDGSWDNVLPKCIQDIQFRIILKGSSTQREMCLTVDKDPDKPLVKAPCTPLQSNDGSQLFKWGFTSDHLVHPDSGKCMNGSRQTWGKIRLSNCSDADPDQMWDCGESSGIYEYSLRLRNSSSFLDNGPSADYLPTPIEGLLHVVMETDYYETSLWFARHHFGKGTVCSMRSTKQCPPFPQILNGVVSPSSCHDHSAVVKGLVCSVTCDAGYMLDLTEQAVCGSDGTWSTPIPVCTGVLCAARAQA